MGPLLLPLALLAAGAGGYYLYSESQKTPTPPPPPKRTATQKLVDSVKTAVTELGLKPKQAAQQAALKGLDENSEAALAFAAMAEDNSVETEVTCQEDPISLCVVKVDEADEDWLDEAGTKYAASAAKQAGVCAVAVDLTEVDGTFWITFVECDDVDDVLDEAEDNGYEAVYLGGAAGPAQPAKKPAKKAAPAAKAPGPQGPPAPPGAPKGPGAPGPGPAAKAGPAGPAGPGAPGAKAAAGPGPAAAKAGAVPAGADLRSAAVKAADDYEDAQEAFKTGKGPSGAVTAAGHKYAQALAAFKKADPKGYNEEFVAEA